MPSTPYQQALQNFENQLNHHGRRMQPPCSQEELVRLRLGARQELGSDIPDPHAELLRWHNGITWNGLTIYASETSPIAGRADRFIAGFVESNKLFQQDVPDLLDYLIFADSEFYFYAYDKKNDEYVRCDRISLEKYESFSSFEDMISSALLSHL
ncbi:MAG TPA: YrhA family protein [Archangium sp.]|nr:YrhA family protein [Archangium sp.]